jgi:hypothetical protein
MKQIKTTLQFKGLELRVVHCEDIAEGDIQVFIAREEITSLFMYSDPLFNELIDALEDELKHERWEEGK